jgi:transposase-like protein
MIEIPSLRKRESERFTTITGGNLPMRSASTPAKEQYKLIMECRRSGLSDHEWCQERGIKPSTFYNWIRRLRLNGCTDFQESGKPLKRETAKQDVVRISFEDNSPSSSIATQCVDNKPCTPQFTQFSPPPIMEISIGDIKLKITNGFDANLLSQTLKALKVVSC